MNKEARTVYDIPPENTVYDIPRATYDIITDEHGIKRQYLI